MSYPVNPDYNHQVGYQLVSIPRYGVLLRAGAPLHVGERFTERDIQDGVISYRQTANLPEGSTGVKDGFRFQLFDRGLLVTDANQYVSCMPDREVPVPLDGVYQFDITIQATPTPGGVAKGFALKQGTSRPLTDRDLDIAGVGSRRDQVVHTLERPLKSGELRLNGRVTQQFTQGDVADGRVVYHHTGALMLDEIALKSCNQFSKCVRNVLPISFTPTVAFTGDNVFYGRIGSKWQTTLTATKSPLLWDLIGGTISGPPLSPEAIGTVYWTYYDARFQSAGDPEDRGAGYDKLPQYQNQPLKYQWNGGLPLGTYLDNMEGLVSTASRLPYDPLNDVTWVLPLVPSEFKWRVMITDPYTGENAVRDYTLRVTETGLSPTGETSETL